MFIAAIIAVFILLTIVFTVIWAILAKGADTTSIWILGIITSLCTTILLVHYNVI
jgi:hypothetical protein